MKLKTPVSFVFVSLSGLLSVFGSLRRSRKRDRIKAPDNFSDAGHRNKAPHFPSPPLTPAYVVKMSGADREEISVLEDGGDDVACRRFEKYLAEMMVDDQDGKVRDLVDVEELLYCWKNLKCPVFTDLVRRFYGGLCNNLFSNSDENINAPY